MIGYKNLYIIKIITIFVENMRKFINKYIFPFEKYKLLRRYKKELNFEIKEIKKGINDSDNDIYSTLNAYNFEIDEQCRMRTIQFLDDYIDNDELLRKTVYRRSMIFLNKSFENHNLMDLIVMKLNRIKDPRQGKLLSTVVEIIFEPKSLDDYTEIKKEFKEKLQPTKTILKYLLTIIIFIGVSIFILKYN